MGGMATRPDNGLIPSGTTPAGDHVTPASPLRKRAPLTPEQIAAARKLGFALYPKDKNPLTRIYRDIRFSSDKTPFHTYLGASLRGSPAKASLGELYIHIEAEQPFVAAGFWMPERPFLHVWRERMNIELLSIWSKTKTTVIFITHSIHEAVYLSSRVIVMSARPGRIINDIRVDLPQPRGPEVRDTEAFFHLVSEVRAGLRA